MGVTSTIPRYNDRVYAFDTNATFKPDELRSHRDDDGGGSMYVSNARPARKRAVDNENGDTRGCWLLDLFVAIGTISSLLTLLLRLLRPLLLGMEYERIIIAEDCPAR